MPTIKRLPPLPRVSDIVKLYGLRAKQQLSQNFLLDLNLTNKIVRVSGNLEGNFVCEVGPGPGSLTRSILNAGVERLLVVEKDKRFLPSLELLSEASNDRLLIHYGDVLELDIESNCKDYVKQVSWEDGSSEALSKHPVSLLHVDTLQYPTGTPSFHIIGNLPFNISIPLLLKWLSCIPKRTGPFAFGRTPMTLTFQKEVAERLTAPIHHHQRSRLSIMAQTWCDVKWHFTIPGSSFVPAPKVDAAVVQFLPLVQPTINVDFDTLETVVKAIFQHRRKIILKGIRVLFPRHPQMVHEMIRLSGVNPNLRAQQLSLIQFEHLCSAYKAVTTSSQQQQQEHTEIMS